MDSTYRDWKGIVRMRVPRDMTRGQELSAIFKAQHPEWSRAVPDCPCGRPAYIHSISKQPDGSTREINCHDEACPHSITGDSVHNIVRNWNALRASVAHVHTQRTTQP